MQVFKRFDLTSFKRIFIGAARFNVFTSFGQSCFWQPPKMIITHTQLLSPYSVPDTGLSVFIPVKTLYLPLF